MYNSNDLTGVYFNYVRINTSHQNNMNIPAGDRNRNFFFRSERTIYTCKTIAACLIKCSDLTCPPAFLGKLLT